MKLYSKAVVAFILTLFVVLPIRAAEQAPLVPDKNELVRHGEDFACKGNWQAAAREFFEAVCEDENNALAFYDLGVAYFHLGDLPKALTAEKQAILLRPDFVNAHIQLATINSRAGDNQAAESALSRALEIEPNNAIAKNNLDALLAAKKQIETPKSSPPAAIPQPTESTKAKVSPNEVVLSNSPIGSVSGKEAVAPSVLAAEGVRLREVICKKILKPEIAASFQEALTACRNGQLDAAKKMLSEIIAEDSSISSAYAGLGAISGMQGDYDADITKEKIAIELDEGNVVAHYNLAWALAHQNRWHEALSENDRALELDPQFTEAAVGKALAQSELGCQREAKDLVKSLIERNGSDILPRLAMSVLLEREGALEASQNQLTEVLKIDPDNVAAKLWLAARELKRENWTQARELYGQLVETNPRQAQAWLGLGLALNRLAEPATAIEDFRKAAELAPESAAAHMALGLALEQSGNVAEAAQQLKEAHRLNPASHLAEAPAQGLEKSIK